MAVSERQLKWITKHPEEHKLQMRIRAERYRNNPTNHIKEMARRQIFLQVRSGRLVPLPCNRCGSTKGRRGHTEAHHKDYSKPLEIEWLCTLCHVVADKELKDSDTINS